MASRAPFHWEDPLLLEELLSEDERMIRDAARAYCQENLQTRVLEANRHEIFHREIMTEMGELGLLGPTIPEEYGGPGVNHVAYGLVAREVERVDSGYRSAMSVQSSLVMHPIYAYGSEEQRKKYLPKLATGEWVGCFGLTEPDHGSDVASITTRAVRDGDGWVLNGTKTWATNGGLADVHLVTAVVDPDLRTRGQASFIVPPGTKGLSQGQKFHKHGIRASHTAEVVLDQVRVPGRCLLGGKEKLDARLARAREGASTGGSNASMATFERTRPAVGAQAVGIARAAYETALDYAKTREQFGKPIIENQGVAFQLADMATQIAVARQMVHHAACLREAGLPCLSEASMAKLFASEMAERVCSAAIQTLGGYGYLKDFPVERIYRDVRVCQIYEGTSDIQRMVIARALAD